MNKFEINPQTDTAIDEDIYNEFSSIKQLSAYNYFAGEREYHLNSNTLQDEKIMQVGVREKTKQNFLSNEVHNPNLTYPKLNKFNASAIEQQFLKLKEHIKTDTLNETVRKLYLWKINEKIAENRMLQAAKNRDDRKFIRYSKFINGSPDKKIFDYTLSTLLVDVQKALNDNSNILAQEAAKRLQQEFSSHLNLLDNITLQTTEPTSNILSLKYKDEEFQTPAMNSITIENADKKYSDQEIVIEFTRALNEYKLSDWDVIIDDTKTAISVGNKKIIIPKDKELSKLQLHGLIAHEIGVHARRSTNGKRTRLKILKFGLDRSKDDEGVAMYEQQKITGMRDFAGFDGYFAISLAMGMDGKKRDFRDVFDVLTDYYIIRGNTLIEAQNKAWNRCVRTFRGTTGNTPGACFTKDLFYRENNIGIWNLVKQNSSEVRRFMVGRYDPTNSRHIWILDQLNITEKDFDNLEK